MKNDYIYAFCSKKTNETTIFKGSSVITREQQRLIDQHIEEARLRDKELNDKLKELDVNHRGIQYYTRPMIIQGGGASYTNYFQHENRKETEEKVFQFVDLSSFVSYFLYNVVHYFFLSRIIHPTLFLIWLQTFEYFCSI